MPDLIFIFWADHPSKRTSSAGFQAVVAAGETEEAAREAAAALFTGEAPPSLGEYAALELGEAGAGFRPFAVQGVVVGRDVVGQTLPIFGLHGDRI